jgi:hypothetical protein
MKFTTEQIVPGLRVVHTETGYKCTLVKNAGADTFFLMDEKFTLGAGDSAKEMAVTLNNLGFSLDYPA